MSNNNIPSRRQRARSQRRLASDIVRFGRLLKSELARSSDRSLVIMSVAMVEECVSLCVRKSLCTSMSKDDPLVDGPTAPLGSFYSKLLFARSTGMFSKDFVDDLNILREIRNEFAHGIATTTLQSKNVKARLEKLSHLLNGTRGEGMGTAERGRFVVLVIWILDQISLIKHGIKKCRPAPMHKLYVESAIMKALDIDMQVSPRAVASR